MTLKFYFDFMSQPVRALYIFLKKNNIAYEPVRINLKNGEHKTAKYLAINPLGVVPTIDDNGFILRESVGIFRYLCREKDVPGHWYPQDSKMQAKIDEYLEWQHLGTRYGCGMFFKVHFLEPLVMKKKPVNSELERYREGMIRTCDTIENVWLKGSSRFLFGNEITVADLMAATELEQPRIAGYDPREGRPRVAAFLKEVKAETSPHYEDAHKIIEALEKARSTLLFKVSVAINSLFLRYKEKDSYDDCLGTNEPVISVPEKQRWPK